MGVDLKNRTQLTPWKRPTKMTIVAAAIRINHAVISMAAPARHHDILRQIAGLYDPQDRPDWTYENETQGFLTDKGEFLNRRDAFRHTVESGQGQPRRRTGAMNYQGGELYSEDLW
jgi:hypothetical protein